MRKIILAFSLFAISACTVLQADFIPENDKLNDATVGRAYYSQINILGGHVISYDLHGKKVIVGDITPDNIGLRVQYCNEKNSNNCIQIRGVPIKTGTVKVRVYGGLAGGMFSKAGEFDKTYTIKINPPGGSS